MQRSEIRTESRRLLSDTNSIKFTDSILNDWIDLWNIELVTRLELDKATSTVTLTGSDTYASSEPNYNLGAIYLYLTEVYLDDVNDIRRRLKVIDQDELNDYQGEDWRENDARNLGNPEIAYLADYNVLGIYPRPNAANNGNTLEVFGYRDTADFSGDTSESITIRALHASGPWYVASQGYALLGDTGRSEYHRKRFEDIFSQHKMRQQTFSSDMKRWRWY